MSESPVTETTSAGAVAVDLSEELRVSVAFEMMTLAALDISAAAGSKENRRNAMTWASGLSRDGISFADCCKAVGADPVVMRIAILGDPVRFMTTVKQLVEAVKGQAAGDIADTPRKPRFF